MHIKNGKMVYGFSDCHCAMSPYPGRMPNVKNCPKCNGTERIGKSHCSSCTNGTILDWSYDDLRVCPTCNGTMRVLDDRHTIMDRETSDPIWRKLPKKLYILSRGITFNESFLGFGCVWSCHDYGEAYDALTSAKNTEEFNAIANAFAHNNLMNASTLQACKIVDNDDNVCDHIAVLISKGGYSVRASFRADGSDVIKRSSEEPPEALGYLIGREVYNSGGHGTLAAAGFFPRT